MNQEVPQPTTAMRAPDAGSSACSVRIPAARAQVSGCEVSSARMCAPAALVMSQLPWMPVSDCSIAITIRLLHLPGWAVEAVARETQKIARVVAAAPQQDSAPLGGLGVVADDLGDHEVEPLLGELRIEMRRLGEPAQPRHLLLLSLGVRRGHLMLRLQTAHLLCGAEALGQHEDQGGV